MLEINGCEGGGRTTHREWVWLGDAVERRWNSEFKCASGSTSLELAAGWWAMVMWGRVFVDRTTIGSSRKYK